MNLFQSAVFFFAKFPGYFSVISLIDNLSFSYFLLSFFAFSLSSTFNLILFVRFAQKQKTPDAFTSGVYIQLGGDLLSHGNIPHYHRHYGVSLLSSGWVQVGPPHYRRQNSVDDLNFRLLYLTLYPSNQNKLTLNFLSVSSPLFSMNHLLSLFTLS